MSSKREGSCKLSEAVKATGHVRTWAGQGSSADLPAHEEPSYAGHDRDSRLHQLDSRPASRLGGPSESRRRANEGLSAVKRVLPGLLLLIMVAGTGQLFALQTSAIISGTVRDVRGTPQMGALIELMRADGAVATAVSDDHGRYIMATVTPGRYQLRATAAFFIPVLRNQMFALRAGVQSIVNLTMNNLFDADNWLPAQRRRADEPVDDWKWTLRSAANRPLLRLVDPESGAPISSSADQPRRVSSQGKITLTSGDGAFGDGGMHQALVFDRTMEDGDGAVLRADLGDVQAGGYSQPSIALMTGYERRSLLGGTTRMVSSFQSHPELTDGASSGFQVLRLASTQQFALGDLFLIDAGTLMEAERLEQTRLEAEPFIRFTARPGNDVIVEYRYASSRELQSSDDLDQLKHALSVVPDSNGKPLSDRGMHNQFVR